MHHDLTVTDQIYINFEDRERGEAIERISNYPLNSQPVEDHSERASPVKIDLQDLPRDSNFSEQSIELLAEKIISYLDKRTKVQAQEK
jgi:hypothetical protein